MEMPAIESRAEVIIEILEISLQKNKRARLLDCQRAPRLAYSQVLDCLSFAMNWGLLTFVRKDGAYMTTKKGKDFLKSYRWLSKSIETS